MALLKTFPLDPDAGYGFEWLRAMLEVAPLQEGVIGAGDFKVTPAAAGGNRGDVAAGWALVKGDSGLPALGLTQGLYLQGNDAAIANAVTFDAGGAQPRLDQVVLTANDTSDLGSASNVPAITIVKGAEVPGTTLDNGYSNGSAGALPQNAVRLADRLVPAGASTVNAVDVRDRRKWARGAYRTITRAAADRIISSGTPALIDSANAQPRVECSGAPLRARLKGNVQIAAAGDWASFRLFVDGVESGASMQRAIPPSVGNAVGFEFTWPIAPAAGSHLIGPAWSTQLTTNNITLKETGGMSWDLTVEELVRQNADNT